MLFLYNNKPRILVITYCTFALGTVFFCALLIKGYSAAGAAAGAGLAEVLSIGVLLPRAATAIVSVSALPFLRHSYTVAAIAFVLSYGIAYGLAQLIVPHSLVSILWLAFAWTACVAMPAFFLLLASTERQWVRQQINLQFSKLWVL